MAKKLTRQEIDVNTLFPKQVINATLKNGCTGNVTVTIVDKVATMVGVLTIPNASILMNVAMLPFELEAPTFLPIHYSRTNGYIDANRDALVLYPNGGLNVTGTPTGEITFTIVFRIK